MKIVIFGASGMLGYDLVNYLRSINVSDLRNGKTYQELDIQDIDTPSHSNVDITDRTGVNHYLSTMKSHGFDTVINCAAATDVNGIQSCVSDEQKSYALNALAPKYLAEACKFLKMRLIHISTDYVYSDLSLETSMYHDEFPKNIYGYHKLMGELFIKSSMDSNYSIIRVGCLYGMHKSKSFIHKFLKNVANSIRNKNFSPLVINYQRSTPTSTSFVCKTIFNVLKNDMFGTMTASPKGHANRFEFAEKILKFANETEKFPDELISVNVKKDFTELNYCIPPTSCMNEINQGSHLYSNVSLTWEDDLSLFFRDNCEELAKWFRHLLEEDK